ncbi:hypothetical protein PR202_ga31226 [Eleusine coracana subsp. coracana]|uniref:Uncharacterized protein n=1 Tax=Eleusine coracana subsp. coracana TaxID=191504 RepID=A0AAV5DRA5_ELECO|nr:hypothetical protein PR202_ga31226 [Eleusine coracana subsp. coracana]
MLCPLGHTGNDLGKDPDLDTDLEVMAASRSATDSMTSPTPTDASPPKPFPLTSSWEQLHRPTMLRSDHARPRSHIKAPAGRCIRRAREGEGRAGWAWTHHVTMNLMDCAMAKPTRSASRGIVVEDGEAGENWARYRWRGGGDAISTVPLGLVVALVGDRDEEASPTAVADERGGVRKGVEEGADAACGGGELREQADREQPWVRPTHGVAGSVVAAPRRGRP